MLALIAAAWADPVVHDSDADTARARAAAVAHVDPATLEPVALATLVARSPVGLGGARVVPCTDAPTRPADVESHLKEAAGAYLYMESEKAALQVGLANAAMGCLAEPLDPVLGSRIFYLRGLIAFAANDMPAAEAAFYRARVFVPDLSWDDDFAPDARPLFERTGVQLKVAEPVWLTMVPPNPPGGIRVDGKAVDVVEGRVALAPGPHVVQLGQQPVITLNVDLKSEGTLVVPSLLPADSLAWAGDPGRREALSATFAATLQRDTQVYVTHADGVWKVHAGRDDWAELAAPKNAPVTRPRPAPGRAKKTAGTALAIAGGAVLAGGGALAGISMAQALGAYDDGTNAATWDDYLAAEAVYTPARQRMYLGDAIAGGGAILLATGVVLAW